MSPAEFVSILVALTALIVAIGKLVIDIAELRRSVDGQLANLVTLAQLAAHKEGELEGRDYTPPTRSSAPTSPHNI